MEPRKARLTEGPVGRHLVDMTVPVLLGITMMMAQSFIDAWFLGRVGDRALAAYGFAFPILMIVTSVAIGLSAGTSSVVARAIGAGDDKRARRLSTDSLLLSLAITAVVCLVGVLTIDPLFRLLGAPEDMLPLIRSFMMILYAGIPVLVVGMVGMASMRATGDTRLPSKLMVAGAILNVALDPIFIFGVGPVPALGLNGVAVAALLARGIVAIGAFFLLRNRLDLLAFEKPRPGELRQSWRDILHVGAPAAGTNVIVPVATAIITAMIASYGPDAVAGYGVAGRVESLVLVMFYALSAIIGPFVGQNLSAGNHDRMLEALRLCSIFCVASGLVIAALLAGLAGFLPTLFSDNPEVIRVTRLYLWLAPLGYGTYGMVMVMNAAFNGIGQPLPGVVISLTRTLFLYVPLALVAKQWFDIPGIFATYTVANVVTGIGAYLWARKRILEVSARSAAPAVSTPLS